MVSRPVPTANPICGKMRSLHAANRPETRLQFFAASLERPVPTGEASAVG